MPEALVACRAVSRANREMLNVAEEAGSQPDMLRWLARKELEQAYHAAFRVTACTEGALILIIGFTFVL